jgi:hypothetical protein
MDLSKIKFDDVATMVVKHPTTGEDTDFEIDYYGIESKVYNTAKNKYANEAINDKNPTAETGEIRGLSLLADCGASWRNAENGKDKIEFTRDNLFDLLKKHKWLKNQSNEFIGDRANHLKN